MATQGEDERDSLSDLMEKAEVQGYLTTGDILEVMPETEDLVEQIEGVYQMLQEAGVDVYEEKIDLGTARTEDGEDAEEEDEAVEEGDEEYDLTNIASDDVVGL